MKNYPTSKAVCWLLLSIVSAGSMAFYVDEIWSAHQPPHFNDLYARWWGAHELLLNGRNPYSPAVSHEIQTVIYGASADAGSPDDPTGIGGGFAYPPYVALLLWPTIYLSFPAAQKVFLCVSTLAALVSFVLWLRLLRFRWSLLTWLTIAVFTFGSFPSLQAIRLQNPSLLAAAFIAIALFLLSTDRLILAGGLLAVSTFKPQFAIVLIPWLAFWTVADWHRRRHLAWSFLVTMLLLVLVSEWLVTGWISSFLFVIRAYRHYTYGHSLLDVWFTPVWGVVVAACVVISAFALCWKQRSQPADSMSFLLASARTVTITSRPFVSAARSDVVLVLECTSTNILGGHCDLAGLALDCRLRPVARCHPLSRGRLAGILADSAVYQSASTGGCFADYSLFSPHLRQRQPGALTCCVSPLDFCFKSQQISALSPQNPSNGHMRR